MGTGYTRNDSANNIADGNVINASDLDGEFDAVQAAFNGTTGHSHDGTTGEGPQIAAGGIASNAVTTAKILDANVTLAKMAANSVDSDQYVDGSIDTVHIANDAVTGDKLANNIQIAGTLGVTGETTLSTHLNMGDNDIIKLGAGSDLQIYHDSATNHSHITEAGTGELLITGTDIYLKSSGGENYIYCNNDNQVQLYHNNNVKLTTKSDGVDITGELQSDSLDVDGNADISGQLTMGGNVNLQDNDKLQIGSSQDLQLFHDGSNSYINDTGTGDLVIRGNGLRLEDSNTNYAIRVVNGAEVDLRYNGGKKLETKSDGVLITGELEATTLDINGNADISGQLTMHNNLKLQDNDYLQLGSSQDLQIYHNGTDSYIDDTGTGGLILKTNGTAISLTATGGETMGTFNRDGAVTLYYDNSSKLATKSDGVDITGELQSDSLDVDGAANISGTLTMGGNIDLQDNDEILIGNSDDLQLRHDGLNSYIEEIGTGSLLVRGTDVYIQDREGNNFAVFDDTGTGGTVTLYHNAVSKLNTKSDGVLVTGELEATTLDINGAANISSTLTMGSHIFLQDNDYLQLGSSQDLQIYHDGTNSYIDDTGAGSIYIRGNGQVRLQKYTGENMLIGNADGSVDLYHNNVNKLQTTSTGININGNLNAVDNVYVANAIYHEGDTDTYMQFHAANQWRVVTGGTEMLEINDSYLLLGSNSVANVQTATVAGALTPSFSFYNSFIYTLTGNLTLNNPTTEVTGMSGVFIFIHSGGGRTVSLGTDYKTVGGAGLTLSGTSGAVDIVPYYVRSSGNIILGTPQLAFS